MSIESGPPQARMRSVWFLLKLIGSVGVASSLLFAVLHLAG